MIHDNQRDQGLTALNQRADWPFTTTDHLLHLILTEPVWHVKTCTIWWPCFDTSAGRREVKLEMERLAGCQREGLARVRGFLKSANNQAQLNWVKVTPARINVGLLLIFAAWRVPPRRTTASPFFALLCCKLTQTPTDNELLTGWWLRKATRGGVVMATEACQTDCVEIGQVWWTRNQ